MTKRTPTRRSHIRRSRRIYVTTQSDEQSTVKLAQLLTSAALEHAKLEAAAEAEHKARARTAHSADWPSDTVPTRWAGEEAADA